MPPLFSNVSPTDTKGHNMHITVCRHAQSTANAGEPTETPGSTPLTQLGVRQAQLLAESIGPYDGPDLIVTSPYLRTGETAAPMRERFPYAKHEEWPIQEFTYLSPEKHRGTTKGDRIAHAMAFWDKGDPHFKESGAESLADLFGRVDTMAKRLEELAEARPFDDVWIFGHGLFMRALMWRILMNSSAIDADIMRAFRSFCFAFVVPNTAVLPLRYTMYNEWFTGPLGTAHLPPDMITT